MVVPPSTGGGPVISNMNTAFPPPIPPPQAMYPSIPNGDTTPNPPKSRMGTIKPAKTAHAPEAKNPPIPFSARKSEPLDLETVERRGEKTQAPESKKIERPHGIQEAPTYRPTEEAFKSPMEFIRSIAPEASRYGMCKIIPPESWKPNFAIDTERFHFRTRRQELNSVEGGTRANLNYLDQLAKFHRQHGNNLTRFPSVDKRPLDLFKLKKIVESKGGFEDVCKFKMWAAVGRELGYSGKIMSSLSTSLKNSYQKWLLPYEEYLRQAKPGVYQQLEMENGGPYTPSPGPSPLKKPQHTPSALGNNSPAMRASVALNDSLQEQPPAPPPVPPLEPPKPVLSSGFTPVNAGGFTAVNTAPPAHGFSAVNAPHLQNGVLREPSLQPGTGQSTPQRLGVSPMSSAQNTPNLGPTGLGLGPVGNGRDDGRVFSSLKRSFSVDGESDMNGEVDANGRRSKRLKKDGAPTVSGSHMTQPRLPTQQRMGALRDRPQERNPDVCQTCGIEGDKKKLLSCDSCGDYYHRYCLDPPLQKVPEFDWHCPRCLVGTGEYGFEEGGVYSLKEFQERANKFKEDFFKMKIQIDPITNTRMPISEEQVEKEFWRLVESITETVEVDYGADIHSTTHGSGFPTVEKNPRNPYSVDPWNLNVLPLDKESLFRHIQSDISGMTVPWVYVGMVFSTFCWHNEDHYCYSANYQHMGATKTWYGIPAEDAEKFEETMRATVPELFETQPDLLFQLVTLLSPTQLRKAGVRVYALDQRAGQFVITFPQAYHAGFNHGFNVNEAVNFAPADWEPFGDAGVQRLQDFRRQPCFSHDQLLLTAASRDHSIKTARWLGPALERMLEKETAARDTFMVKHEEVVDSDLYKDAHHDIGPVLDAEAQEEFNCCYCKAYCFLSRFVCTKTGKVLCPHHAGTYECCDLSEQQRFAGIKRGGDPNRAHTFYIRETMADLKEKVQKVVDTARTPENWVDKLDKLVDDDPRPALKSLKGLVTEGERINNHWELEQLPELKRFVERCNEWVEEAISFIQRKQQSRRKSEKGGRKMNAAKAAEQEERERELRKVENIKKLLHKADEISFDCPEISTLRERADAINDFQKKARNALTSRSQQSTQGLEELIEVGKGFNVDMPEVEALEKELAHFKWFDQAKEFREKLPSLSELVEFMQQGTEIGIPEDDSFMVGFRESKAQGELWESKIKEVLMAESIHYPQLNALSKQAATLPVAKDTLSQVEAILKKHRDAEEQILSLWERSKDPDFRKRPQYPEVRDCMEAISAMNSKPTGTLDLEKEQKKHEDWMRRGKKLFGKANAPLHILLQHMKIVEQRNEACFDLTDQPRMPVEPSSRANTPDDDQNRSGSIRDVFCICRKPEAGMMIECELCQEWYHGKCLKIARGKVKEDDKYTCPICDYRVKIPRDATRPKLEDLIAWQEEIPTLPFQPEEEECLNKIIKDAMQFRNYLSAFINPLYSVPDEVGAQRFYLRKIEGADILLAKETNFFRQELHKYAPVAPEPPPVIEISGSTRKPRPTKQQKKMKELGIDNPEDLPPEFRTKTHQFKARKVPETNARNPQVALALKPNSRSTEESHTPPGLPHGYPSNSPYLPPSFNNTQPPTTVPSRSNSHPTFSFDAMAASTSSYQVPPPVTTSFGSPLFASNNAFSTSFNSPPPVPTALDSQLDPAIFGSPAVPNPFGSSQNNFNDIFGDLTSGTDAMKSMAAHALGLAGGEDEADVVGEGTHADGLEFLRNDGGPEA